MSTVTTALPQSLIELGIVLPGEDECRQLDELGYVILPGIMDDAWRHRLGERLDQLDGHVPIIEELKQFQVEAGTTRFTNLVDQGPLMDLVWSHPRLLGCVWHVLQRSFKISGLNAREPKVGQGHQGLHADWGRREETHINHAVNCLCLLDGMERANGATRLVPGSHRIVGSPGDRMADTSVPHPDEVIVEAPAGAVVVYNAHCWHSGTINHSGARRRILHSYFTGREHTQQQEQRRWLSEATKARLDSARRWLLDA